MSVSFSRRMKPRNHAFSLVEVTIAVGITAFAILVIFGLNVSAVNTLRDAISDSVCARISQAITQSVALGEFDGLTGADYYFDADGMSVASTDREAAYRASVGLVSPGVDSIGISPPDPLVARGVRLEIFPVGGPRALHSRTFFVARSGKLFSAPGED